MSTCTSYVPTNIYIADMRTKEVSKCTVTSERNVFRNSNVMPTLRGFRWYPYFGAQEKLVAFEASKPLKRNGLRDWPRYSGI